MSRSSSVDGVLLVDKPAGKTSHDIVAAVRRAPRRASASATPARSTRSRPACCWSSSAAPRGSSASSWTLPKTYEAVARLGAVSTTGDPEGEITETGRGPARPAARCRPAQLRQRPPRLQRGQGRRRAGLRAGAARRGGRGARARRDVHRFEQLWRDGDRAGLRDRVLGGDLRARRSSPTSATPTARSCGAPRSGRSTSRDADPDHVDRRSPTRWRFLPAVRLDADDARRAAAQAAVRSRLRAVATSPVLLVDADGPDRRSPSRGRAAAEARRRLPRMKVASRSTDAEPPPAARRRGDVRRRPPRPPRGHPRRRHRR